jgi:bacillithiol synthase
MIKSSVQAAETGLFSPLFLDYLAQREELKPFYNEYPAPENFKKLISQKLFSLEKRGILMESLRRQYGSLKEEVESQIQRLGDPKTFTVTTGHQLNLMTGPLYFIYKIVSTINLAKSLNQKYPDCHFVPIYWMASEDHDFDEINYFRLDGNKYQWQSSQTGAVGDFKLDREFRNWLDQLGFIPEIFKDAYGTSEKLSEAVRKYVHRLFGAEGLLIIDGHDGELKKQLIPVIEKDLFSQIPYKLATDQTSMLEDLGYKSQIFARQINFFYLADGVRERIERKGEKYFVLNTDLSFDEAELRQLIYAEPERFSPNVVLRPVYQELILPNLAYLGGPAEVAYWLQLKPVFDEFGVMFPAVMPRNFALVIDAPLQRKIQNLGLQPKQLFESVAEWKRKFVRDNALLDFQMAQEKSSLDEVFERSKQAAQMIDPSLGPSYEAAKVRVRKLLDHLGGKVRKSEEKRLQMKIRQRQEISDSLFPGGSPQERIENFMKFYLEDQTFIEQLYECFDPFDFHFLLLSRHGKG